MLYANQAQWDALIASRRQFNNSQRALAARIGDTMIGNAQPVPRYVWETWDREGVELQREVLSVFNDLSASVNMAMPIGKLIHYFQTISDSGDVNISLDGRSKARTDQPLLDYHGTPLPIIDSTFSFGWRQMAAAASEGYALDPAGRVNAQFKVAKKLEDLMLNGDSKIVVGTAPLYGLLNHPKRKTDTTGIALNGATGAQWKTAMSKVTAALYSAKFFEAPTIYVNVNDWKYARETDYTTTYPKTIAARLIEGAGIANVVPASNVPADTLIGVVKSNRVLQVLNGMPLSTRAKMRDNPEDDYNFVTMAAAALEIKYDAADNCGVAVITNT